MKSISGKKKTISFMGLYDLKSRQTIQTQTLGVGDVEREIKGRQTVA
jgi:hypothetical protein